MTERLFLNTVYAPSGIESRVEDLITIYQEAFASAPWNERGKCASVAAPASQCVDGFSPLEVGEMCGSCSLHVTEDAYPRDELKEKFLATKDEHALWYVEETGDRQIGLAVLARTLTVEEIAEVKYKDNTDMADWLIDQYESPGQEVLWLDEVFADTRLRPEGNLRNFGQMCMRLVINKRNAEIAFRTLNPKLISAARRDFGNTAETRGTSRIFDPVLNQIPDRRKFVRLVTA
jgi:hypothetical protein